MGSPTSRTVDQFDTIDELRDFRQLTRQRSLDQIAYSNFIVVRRRPRLVLPPREGASPLRR
jgi:hypothetical protein